jgi:hypothetical protein
VVQLMGIFLWRFQKVEQTRWFFNAA